MGGPGLRGRPFGPGDPAREAALHRPFPGVYAAGHTRATERGRSIAAEIPGPLGLGEAAGG